MTPALGRLLILVALTASAAGALLGFAIARRPTTVSLTWLRRLAYAFGGSMIAANLLMVYALVTHDFSVGYVAQVGSRDVPLWVTIVSLWSSLEGSILFWGLVLGGYVMVATRAVHRHHPSALPYAAGVWLATGAFFSLLLAGPAQPFATVSPVPADGPGPNPLLQNHVLMAVHPPFLYLGYVGMTIPFGLASAALLLGSLGPGFLRTLRSSLLFPWTFLSIAIVMGGWWAYEVLGWGGYWAWDPVENASFLPWLTATAALHSGLLTERKGVLKGWTLTLVLATFLLTILGTFMTRSGVFNSVHSFTQSAIGPTILVFLAAALLWSVIILAKGMDRLERVPGAIPSVSRESAFLVNNLLFVLFTFTVLLGTVFPLVVEAVRGVQMSVGEPYFNKMAVPVGLALLFLMGVGPALPWGRVPPAQAARALAMPLVGAAIGVAIPLALGVHNGWTLVTSAFGGFAAWVTLRELARPVAARLRQGQGVGRALAAHAGPGRRRFAGYLVHASVVVIMAAIAVSSTVSTSVEKQLSQGESVDLGRYRLTFVRAEAAIEPHRQSLVAHVRVEEDGAAAGMMQPRMTYYPRQREPIGTPDVRSTWREDLYLSVLNVDPERQTLGLHAIVKPMVGWIWGATALLGLGGLLAVLPTRRTAVTAPAVAHAAVTTPAGRPVTS